MDRHYTHFSFTSGANPYISFTKENRKEVLRLFARKGYGIKRTNKDMYLIDDRRGNL